MAVQAQGLILQGCLNVCILFPRKSSFAVVGFVNLTFGITAKFKVYCMHLEPGLHFLASAIFCRLRKAIHANFYSFVRCLKPGKGTWFHRVRNLLHIESICRILVQEELRGYQTVFNLAKHIVWIIRSLLLLLTSSYSYNLSG